MYETLRKTYYQHQLNKIKYIYIFLCLFINTNLFAQKESSCAITLEYPIVMFKNYHNKLFNCESKRDSVLIESKYGIFNYNKQRFVGNINSPEEKKDYIKIFSIKDTSKLLIFESNLIWKNIPLPKVYLPGTVSDTLNCDLLHHLNSLRLNTNNLYVGDVVYKIKSFNITLEINGKLETLESNSAKFTKEQKQAFSKLENGAFFYVENIKIQDPTGLIRESEILKIYISK